MGCLERLRCPIQIEGSLTPMARRKGSIKFGEEAIDWNNICIAHAFQNSLWCGVLLTGLSTLMLLALQQYGLCEAKFIRSSEWTFRPPTQRNWGYCPCNLTSWSHGYAAQSLPPFSTGSFQEDTPISPWNQSTDPHIAVLENPSIHIHKMSPIILPSLPKMLRSLVLPFKALVQFLLLLWFLCVRIPPPDVFIVQD